MTLPSTLISSQGENGFYTTILDNEYIDLTSTPLSSIILESISPNIILPIKINDSDIIYVTELTINDFYVKSLQIMDGAGTKIKWTGILAVPQI